MIQQAPEHCETLCNSVQLRRLFGKWPIPLLASIMFHLSIRFYCCHPLYLMNKYVTFSPWHWHVSTKFELKMTNGIILIVQTKRHFIRGNREFPGRTFCPNLCRFGFSSANLFWPRYPTATGVYRINSLPSCNSVGRVFVKPTDSKRGAPSWNK